MVPLSLSHLTVLDVAPPALFDLAAEAGYQGVGIRILPAAPGAVSYPLTPSAVAEWRQRMAQAGVGVHDVEFVPLTPQVRVERLARPLALAAELGTKRLNVSGDDEDIGRLAANFARLCDMAAGAGLGVDLEFMRFRPVGTLAQALEVIERARRPNGRLLIDVLHLVRSGGTAQRLAQVPAGALGSLQLCDAPLLPPPGLSWVDEAREARLFPGEGALPLMQILDALPTGLPISVETPTARSHPHLGARERAAAACAATRRLLDAWRALEQPQAADLAAPRRK